MGEDGISIRASFAAVAVLATVFAAMIGVFALGVAPASAHDRLVASSPAEGETLDAPPAEATLRFSAEPVELGSEVALARADGTAIPLDEPLAIDAAEVEQPLPVLEAGEYALTWRITSSDGHPVDGVVHFSIAASAASAAPDAAGPDAPGTDVTGTEAASPIAGEATVDAADDAEGAEPSPTSTEASAGVNPLGMVIGGVVGLAVVGLAVALIVARHRRGNAPPPA